jgi:cytochrome c biogenesis protein CcmG, thiol:disulfide interchange protein DsbE
MSKTTLFQIAVVGIVLAFVALFAASLQLNAAGQRQAGSAPDFTFTQFDGKSYKLSDLRGKVVVLNIWASWCDPCKDEAATLENTWRAYRDNGVMLLGADYVDTQPPAQAFLLQYNITYPNGPDLGSNIYRAFRARGVPETYIIDRHGEIARVFVGPVDETQLKTTLDDLLTRATP